jgi:hypothetical protein
MQFVPSTAASAAERRRYALGQMAADIGARQCNSISQITNERTRLVDCAEALLAEIERREKETK